MTLVFAAIAPHGGLVFDRPDGETRRGMDELARRFAAAAPDAVIIATPHGTLLDDRFGVVRAGRLSEHASRFVEDARAQSRLVLRVFVDASRGHQAVVRHLATSRNACFNTRSKLASDVDPMILIAASAAFSASGR